MYSSGIWLDLGHVNVDVSYESLETKLVTAQGSCCQPEPLTTHCGGLASPHWERCILHLREKPVLLAICGVGMVSVLSSHSVQLPFKAKN